MRTKQTGKAAAHADDEAAPIQKATATPPTDDNPNPKPSQPVELSDHDRAKMKTWLDRVEKPFTAVTKPLSKKRKRDAPVRNVQADLFADELSIQYEVRPRDKWESLRRYKKFTVGPESIAAGQSILVKHADDGGDDGKINFAQQWKARVLEVRALDSEHVYIRVAWLNRPEDLPDGRKPYHGRHELIPTNQMDVIDAMAVNGSLEVRHWDDKDDGSALPEEDQYFWRQTYDFGDTKKFSELPTICTDEQPINPDEIIVQCSADACRQWLHVKCIAEQAVSDAASTSTKPSTAPNSPRKKAAARRPRDSTTNAGCTAVASARKGKWTAEVFIQGLPARDGDVPAQVNEIVLTGPGGGKGEQEVVGLCCLVCGGEIVE